MRACQLLAEPILYVAVIVEASQPITQNQAFQCSVSLFELPDVRAHVILHEARVALRELADDRAEKSVDGLSRAQERLDIGVQRADQVRIENLPQRQDRPLDLGQTKSPRG